MIRVGIIGGTGALGKEIILAVNQCDDISVGAVITHNQNRYFNQPLSAFVESKFNDVIVSDDIMGCTDKIDLLIDCTNAAVIESNIDTYSKMNKPLIIATTGLSDDTKAFFKKFAEKAPVCICANFSVACNVFYDIIEYASSIIKQNDVFITESHGSKKKDSPSGTAKSLKEIILNNAGNTEIPIHSIRAGNLTGSHTVTFVDELNNKLEFTYSSGSRYSYALGMMKAVRYLYSQKNGLHDFREIVKKSK